MESIIFIDCARRSGVAFPGVERGLPKTVLWSLPKVSGSKEDGFEYCAMFAAFRANLMALIAVVKPTVIGFEAPINMMGRGSPASEFRTNQSTIEVLYGLKTIVEEVAGTVGLGGRCYSENLGDIKKHITGNRYAEKRDVIKAVQLLGVDVGTPADDNRADAAAGWLLLSSKADPKFRPGRDTPLFGHR